MVGPGDLPARRLVDQPRESLGLPAAVGEDESRARPGELAGQDRRHALPALARQPALLLLEGADLQVVALGHRRLDAPHVAGGERRLPAVAALAEAPHERRHCGQRAHRSRERDALELADLAGEPLHRAHQVHTSPRARDGVDLVEDHGREAVEEPARRLRVEQEVQALRRRDEDLRRRAQEAAPLGRRGVAGAYPEPRPRPGSPRRLEAVFQLLQGAGEVPLDVVVEGLQRGDVDQPDAPRLPGAGRQPVERPEASRQGLAAPGRRGQEQVAAGGDLWPGAPLDLGRRSQALLEPGADGRVEGGERHRIFPGEIRSLPPAP
ncbi:MAG: hypothetical protein M5U13_06085 [Thermoanaerobaculia bacterium]|nr:hypothetical protein [Thermoanaerobaculia bacterium]